MLRAPISPLCPRPLDNSLDQQPLGIPGRRAGWPAVPRRFSEVGRCCSAATTIRKAGALEPLNNPERGSGRDRAKAAPTWAILQEADAPRARGPPSFRNACIEQWKATMTSSIWAQIRDVQPRLARQRRCWVNRGNPGARLRRLPLRVGTTRCACWVEVEREGLGPGDAWWGRTSACCGRWRRPARCTRWGTYRTWRSAGARSWRAISRMGARGRG